MKDYELIVVGGGPAGLAAAAGAWEAGLRKILIVERDVELGGILNQCIHNGFGLHYFKEELTGPEYAGRFIKRLAGTDIEVLSDTMVLDVTEGPAVLVSGRECGCRLIQADSVVLAMGCRERTRGAISIPGSRPAGIFTAGTAQRYINIEGYMVGSRVVILGSGDIGLIMARRLTLEGAKVLACVEVMPHPGGLSRNIAQCLNDFNIPLYLSHTVTDIIGKDRVEKVIVSQVDERRRPIPGTEMEFECDTLLLSVGLIPENELSRRAGIEIDPRTNGPVVYGSMETSMPGVFACGNVVHVHDLVDNVSDEGERAGRSAAEYVLGGDKDAAPDGKAVSLKNGEGVTYTVPQHIYPSAGAADVYFRVAHTFDKSVIRVLDDGEEVLSFRRARMAPGEMEKITIPADKAAALKGTVTVLAQEA